MTFLLIAFESLLTWESHVLVDSVFKHEGREEKSIWIQLEQSKAGWSNKQHWRRRAATVKRRKASSSSNMSPNGILEWWTEFSKLKSARKLMRHVRDFSSSPRLQFVPRETFAYVNYHRSKKSKRAKREREERWGILSIKGFELETLCWQDSKLCHWVYGNLSCSKPIWVYSRELSWELSRHHHQVAAIKPTQQWNALKLNKSSHPQNKTRERNLAHRNDPQFPFAINETPYLQISRSWFSFFCLRTPMICLRASTELRKGFVIKN